MKKPTQLAPVLALTQLLQEHPELPTASWRIDQERVVLRGDVQHDEDTLDALLQYRAVLGGEIEARVCFKCGGEDLCAHLLTVRWRDVEIELVAIMPRAASDAFEGRIAEQRHALVDLDRDSKFAPVDLGVAA